METYIIIENNQVTNKCVGLPPLKDSETAHIATGSYAQVHKNDYYLPSEDRFYSPSSHNLTVDLFDPPTDSASVSFSFQGEIVTNAISETNFSSDKLIIKNFISTGSSATFEVSINPVKEYETEENLILSVKTPGFSDEHGNPTNSYSTYNIIYSSSLLI